MGIVISIIIANGIYVIDRIQNCYERISSKVNAEIAEMVLLSVIVLIIGGLMCYTLKNKKK